MAETKNISKLNIDGTAYEIKDKTAREKIEALKAHTHTADDITSVNASAITGTISVDNLPPAAGYRPGLHPNL